jgi:hypothetical protein
MADDINRPSGATVRLVETAGGKWSVELVNFPLFYEALGPAVMEGFVRCFIHADRLVSMGSFAGVSRAYYGENSVPFGRDLHAVVWFTIGTLRELALSLRDLRSALVKRGIFNKDSGPWVQFRKLEDRWDGDELFRTMRDKAAFHVDRGLIASGLQTLAREVRDLELSHGEGPKRVGSSFTLGSSVMHNGIRWELRGSDTANVTADDDGDTAGERERALKVYGEFLDHVGSDQSIVADAIQLAFIEAADAVGISFGGN